ncbi:anthranilate synthase component I family protein [Campylobacter suis]|uniref:Isochorismate synthase MenF n=1 Tax=Campylobacter suis TaxID=2790657 RepID=A0ABM8Q0C2_9BACT|nr:anthranilate synthase component I family protein [Campylobacter suis]CAD7286246.1 Isochorismate synthase MenF [Campylobacter suis]
MLLNEPLLYYKNIYKKFPSSYLCEDKDQVIIGIDCDYIDANKCDFNQLKVYFLNAKTNNEIEANFAGFFGVFAHDGVNFFENIGFSEKKQYDFPKFFYANAKAYLHYDKVSKIYTFYGDKDRYFSFLEQAFESDEPKKEFFYKIKTNLCEEKIHFEAIVKKAKEYIASGDIFQVVLSEQLKIETNFDSIDFYKELSTLNPSPYMFHFPTPYGDVVGSSPELVFSLKNGEIFVAPIAGTRPRGSDANADVMLENELLNDEKELAEHKMLIDLARNDIAHVSKPRSVVVKNAMHIQRYQSVMHIVSEVYGQKSDNADAFDVLASIFPAGTLSGTPKIRAMQIISELESFSRGSYGGGIGFINFNQNALIAILIRSAIFVSEGNTSSVFVQAGAGIVYDSIPENEYDEICHKRASVMRVFKDNSKEIYDTFDR